MGVINVVVPYADRLELAYPDRLLYDVDVLEVELHVPILCGYAILGVRQLSDSIGT